MARRKRSASDGAALTNKEKLQKIVSDPVRWIECFCTIVDKDLKKVPVKLTYHQKLLLKNFTAKNIVNKSRQLGITSLALMYSLYLIHTQSDVTCMIMSYDMSTSDIVFKKLKALYDDLSPLVKIPDVNNNRKELLLQNRSRIICCACTSKDTSRGATLRYAHITEVAFMNTEKFEKQIVAIESAMTPDGEIVLESTSNGLNHWFDRWSNAIRGESLYKPFFFSWLTDTRLFAKDYVKSYENYFAGDENGELSRLKLSMLDEEESYLFEKMQGDITLRLQKLAWRRMKIKSIGVDAFHQEYPSTSNEAFLTTGNNYFSSESIQRRLHHIGDVVLHEYMEKNACEGITRYKKDIKIYEYPKYGVKYYGGVDTSEGVGKDSSVLCIVDEHGKQVFEFESNKIKAYQFAELVREIAMYYNCALLVVEKASAGHTVLSKLVDGNNRYPNLYKYRKYDDRGNFKKKYGFETTAKSRPIILNKMLELFEENEIVINSKGLLNEMKYFVADSDGKIQHTRRRHDDRILACAMALHGMVSNMYYVDVYEFSQKRRKIIR